MSWIFFIYFTIQKWSKENSSLYRGLNLSSQGSHLYTKVFLRFALNQDSNLARLSSHFKITIKYVRRYWNMFTVTINPNEHNSYFPSTPPPRKKILTSTGTACILKIRWLLMPCSHESKQFWNRISVSGFVWTQGLKHLCRAVSKKYTGCVDEGPIRLTKYAIS